MEEKIKAKGWEYMWNERLGYVLTCPSNLGTGLRAGVHVKIPLLSQVLTSTTPALSVHRLTIHLLSKILL